MEFTHHVQIIHQLAADRHSQTDDGDDDEYNPIRLRHSGKNRKNNMEN